MLDMEGGEVFEKIRAIWDDARVLLSSGYSETALRKRFRGKGFAGFIQKPYRYATLASAMKGAEG
jgi:two-component system cell cycle sensor histidine kinase/response regulator CckA